MTNKERFIELLRSTKREGIEKLIDFLEKTDFFTAPASTRFHSSYEGGLLQHSLNVYDCLAGLGTTTGDVQEFQAAGMRLDSIPQESIIIVALLHDLCKVNFYATEMRWRKSDSSFLYDLCKDYGLGMKVYKNKIVIWGKSKYEGKKATATIKRADFIGDDWDYTDTLEGTYTGARTSYKKGNDSKEISIYVGLVGEKAKGARTLKISEQSDSENDARYKAAAKVNLENEKATVLTGTIFARPEIVAGICVTVKDLGKADGKYFVDEVKTKVSDSGTTQEIQLHKCQKQLKGDPPPAPPAPPAPAKKTYKVGDIVNFHGGTHYYSSYPGARGYRARAGRAKITLGPNCRGNGHAHPWHLIHVDSSSNVYGWVDEGTFD